MAVSLPSVKRFELEQEIAPRPSCLTRYCDLASNSKVAGAVSCEYIANNVRFRSLGKSGRMFGHFSQTSRNERSQCLVVTLAYVRTGMCVCRRAANSPSPYYGCFRLYNFCVP